MCNSQQCCMKKTTTKSMKLISTGFLIVFLVLYVKCDSDEEDIDRCPNGAFVLERGLSEKDKKAATDEHNRFRQMLLDGVVEGQPQAKYMKTMIYDDVLSDKCVPISNQCRMNHLPVDDDRWKCVGQNIFIEWHSIFTSYQNWTAALESWFYECNDFKYPNIQLNTNQVGHYTQVVWADSDTLGCDFIHFIATDYPFEPFCKMYTCNYGPCGNCNNKPPYLTIDNNSDPDNHTETTTINNASTNNNSNCANNNKDNSHTHTHTEDNSNTQIEENSYGYSYSHAHSHKSEITINNHKGDSTTSNNDINNNDKSSNKAKQDEQDATIELKLRPYLAGLNTHLKNLIIGMLMN